MSKAPAPVRRIVTGHNADGRAVFQGDDMFLPEPVPGGDADFGLIWTTAQVPADNNDPTDGRNRPAGLTLHGGSVIRVVDMLPGGASPFHRSNSIDYGIVMSGEIELELDDDAVKIARAGDIIIQRGTIHLWRNASATQTCRIVFVLTQALPYVNDGQALAEIHP